MDLSLEILLYVRVCILLMTFLTEDGILHRCCRSVGISVGRPVCRSVHRTAGEWVGRLGVFKGQGHGDYLLKILSHRGLFTHSASFLIKHNNKWSCSADPLLPLKLKK